jgi:hypothetical protein
MCKHDTIKYVKLIIPLSSGKTDIPVDACIAEEIQTLIDQGMETLSCCCSHGLAGQISEWENGFGKWKDNRNPAHVLIDGESVQLARTLGYSPYPFYYADGDSFDTWQMHLRTGCVTPEDVEQWHRRNNN